LRKGACTIILDDTGDEQGATNPRTPLAIISHRISGEQPHKAEAAEKSATPTSKTLRRPCKSLKAPPISSSAARNSAYDSTTH
jgi:hypothetical protein